MVVLKGQRNHIVTEEVRKLAVNSAESAEKITDTLTKIRESIRKINVEIKQVSGVNMEQAKLIQEISAQSKSLQDISQHVENLTAKTE